MQICEIFECSVQNLSNSSCHFPHQKSVFLQILHHSSLPQHITNSSLNFKLVHFLLWIKRSHQSHNFETFEYFGENLPDSSCYFPNHKSVFLRILHHSSVSWKITPLYLPQIKGVLLARHINNSLSVYLFLKFEP